MILLYMRKLRVKLVVIKAAIFLVLLFCGCKITKLRRHLEKIHSIDESIDTRGWSIRHYSKFEDAELYNLVKRVDDTTFRFEFWYYDSNSTWYSRTRQHYQIDEYYITYLKNQLYNETLLLKGDTMYSYSCDTSDYKLVYDDISNLDFEVGKYYFLSKFCHISYGQREYFNQHMDSLVRIRGNNLPELPELSK